ncbi:MAG: O-antigen ligase family protein, partial [Porphyrobacter sp.]|nr:O-antigen ligase family protein [Porphyrobacter sp.]
MSASLPQPTHTASSQRLWGAIALLLVIAFVSGGGGSKFGLANLVVQLAAFALLAAFPAQVLRFWREAPLALRALTAASLLVPALQLIPLPPGIWTLLPGRDLVVDSLEAARLEQGWLPFSTYPLRTALALSALVTPLAIVMLGWNLPRHQLLNLGWLVVGLALVTFVIGTVQVSTGKLLNLWPEGLDIKMLTGTFANRNSAGLFLIGGLGLAICLPAPRPHPAVLPLRIAVVVALLVAVVLTKSRTAFVLALMPLLLGLFHVTAAITHRASGKAKARGWLIAAAVLALGGAAIAGTVALAPGRVAETLERFEGAAKDSRKYIWEDATYAASRYWPLGAGMGTFDDVFQVDEALENIGQRRAGRVHNDFIEVAIEAGLPGLVLVAGWLGLIALLIWQARRSSDRWVAWAAASFLL